MAKQQTQKIGGLNCVIQPSDSKGPAVILFHGYGADMYDLAPLADYMGLGPQYTWYFPQGVLEMIMAPGMQGRAWWQIDVSRFERQMVKGETLDLSDSRPDGADHAIEKALSFYNEIAKKHDKVFVGGFSQGSMLAMEISLRVEHKPSGLVLLSGNLVDQKTLEALLAKQPKFPFIQSHGVNDVILPLQGAENLYRELTKHGMRGKFLEFKGGHEIPPKIISEVGSFIASQS